VLLRRSDQNVAAVMIEQDFMVCPPLPSSFPRCALIALSRGREPGERCRVGNGGGLVGVDKGKGCGLL
jgi:hypothetical protein